MGYASQKEMLQRSLNVSKRKRAVLFSEKIQSPLKGGSTKGCLRRGDTKLKRNDSKILSNLLWNVAGKYHSLGPAEPGEFTGPYTELESAACRVAEVAAEGWCFKTLRGRQCSQGRHHKVVERQHRREAAG